MRKTKNYLKKTLMALKKYIQILQRKGKRRKPDGYVGVFSQNQGRHIK